MKIVALAKRVPDSRASIRVKSDGSGIETDGLKYVCDPFDEIGLEQAVRLRSDRSDVEELVALTAGPAGSVEVLRHALAMGADRAVHVLDDGVAHHEEMRLASLAAAAIRRAAPRFGLIVCGTRSIDNGAGEFGPALAELLGVPHAGAVTQLEISDDASRLRAHCRVEGGEIVVGAPLPALVTCERGLAEPRHPPLPRLMKAKKQPVETIEAGELEGVGAAGATLVKLMPPPSRPACRMIEGAPAEMARELVRVLREEAKVV